MHREEGSDVTLGRQRGSCLPALDRLSATALNSDAFEVGFHPSCHLEFHHLLPFSWLDPGL